MTQQVVQKKSSPIDLYNEAIALRAECERLTARYRVDGQLQVAAINEEELRAFEVMLERVRDLKRQFSDQELFMAKYQIVLHGDYSERSPEHSREVSVTLPAGCSRIHFLCEAQDMAVKEHQHSAVTLSQLGSWADKHEFTSESDAPIEIRIIGHIEGSSRLLNRDKVVALLEEKGLRQPTLANLAVAHAAYFVATGMCLFGSSEEEHIMGRAIGGALAFYESGLHAGDLFGGISRRAVAGQVVLDDERA